MILAYTGGRTAGNVTVANLNLRAGLQVQASQSHIQLNSATRTCLRVAAGILTDIRYLIVLGKS